LCNPGWPRTFNLPASTFCTFWGLGLQMCATSWQPHRSLICIFFSALKFDLRTCLTLARQVLDHLSHSTSPVFVLDILELGLKNYFSSLALNCDPPDLCFLNSQDYWCEPPVPTTFFFFLVAGVPPLLIPCG
jgi:hypothetical protein